MMFRRSIDVLALLLGLTVVACGSPPASPSPAETVVHRVAVLGDSLAVTPTLSESFPAILQAFIDRERLPWLVTNASISGDTTADGLRRLEAVLATNPAILVLALGANDGLQGVPVATIQRNLSTIIEAAQARGVDVLLSGMETLPLRGFDYALAFHDLFPRLADQYDVPIVPFLLAGVALIPEMNGSDGIHPNAAGARRIAENVWPYVRPMLLKPRAAALASES